MNNKKNILISFLKDIDEDTYIPPSYFPKNNTKLDNMFNYKELGTNNSKEILLGQLKNEVEKCKKCPLGFSRIKAVFGMGNPYSDIMFIGEGPGWEEDHQGLPFVGKAGQLLDKILSAIELDRSKVYITNIVKCHPMINPETPQARGNDRPPTSQEISTCRFYIEEQIKIIRPKCIIALGNTATRFLLSETKGVSQLRGKFYPLSLSLFMSQELQTVVLPTYHPAALLRNPSLKKETWQDMKMLKDFISKRK
ncbi:MAG: uracil-DNA glycosylase [Elusimicrobiales bacterium]|nr:uracil-DNA glycosylase [Elusimicrobiales bacterium]